MTHGVKMRWIFENGTRIDFVEEETIGEAYRGPEQLERRIREVVVDLLAWKKRKAK